MTNRRRKKSPFADKLLRKLLDDTSIQEIFAAGNLVQDLKGHQSPYLAESTGT